MSDKNEHHSANEQMLRTMSVGEVSYTAVLVGIARALGERRPDTNATWQSQSMVNHATRDPGVRLRVVRNALALDTDLSTTTARMIDFMLSSAIMYGASCHEQ